MSLYRKYRPQTFEDMVGQEHIAQTLRNALSSDPIRIAHAYLFCGPRGTGKTTSARLLAKCLNCEQGPTATPCNECDFCTRVRDNHTTMDLVELDAASNRGIDDAKELMEGVGFLPSVATRRKVYIIDEVHMLTREAFNALLKTLEEPPAHAVFILATTEANKVPVTILSRCQRFDFRRVGPSDIIKRLQYVAQNENINLGDDAARLIAFTADGGLRDALTLLEQVTAFSAEAITEADVRLVLGTVSRELMWELVDSIASQNANAALQAIERATEEGVSFSQLTRDLVAYCRDLLLLTVGFGSDGALSDAEKKRRHEHAQRLGRARLTSCIEALRAAEKEMRQSTDHRLLLELTLVRQTSGNMQDAPAFAAPRLVTAHATLPQSAPTQFQTPQLQTPQIAVSQTSASVSQAASSQAASSPPIQAQSSSVRAAASEPPHEYSNGDASRDEANNGARAASVPEDVVNVAPQRIAPRSVDLSSEEAEINAPLDAAAREIWHAPESAHAIAPEAVSPDEESNSRDMSPQDAQPALEAASPLMSTHVADNNQVASVETIDNAANAQDVAPQDLTPQDSTPQDSTPQVTENESQEAIAPRKKGRRIHDLSEFNELWPAVLARVKRKIGVSAVAYLHDAQPIALDEKEAVLEFQKEFHFEKAREAAKRLPFEQVVNECLASPRILKFKLKPPPDATIASPPVAPAPTGDDDDDDDDGEDVLQLAQDMFGAEVVGRSGEG